MDILINEFPSSWANIFHCGDSDTMRMPSIFIHGNSDDEGSNWEGFIVFWSTVNNDNNYENPGPVLEAGTVYHIELDITQSHWGFSVDGQLMYEGDKDAHDTATTVPCYASFPDEDAADAVINNILITPDASDLTSSPTTDPTSAPTNEPTRTPTLGDTMFIGTSAMSWSDANEYCLGLGRNLISIHSDDDNVAAARLCLSVDHTSSYGCWIGLYDSGSHEYVWSDGSKSDYGFNESTGDPSYAFPWSTNEPSSTGEDCIHIWSNSDSWNDLTCTWSAYPLCKGAPSASPTMDPTSFPTTDPTVDTSTDALITWHCDDSSKLLISRDRGTSWERQPVFSAPYSEVAVRGNNIVNISIDDSMHYAMDITVHSIPDNWVSVFQCGNSVNDHYPTIWMSGSSGTANATYEGFYTSWSNAGSHGKFLEEGQTYHLEVIVNQSWFIVQVDGLATYSSAVSEHETFENVPCYLSNPWYTAADVT